MPHVSVFTPTHDPRFLDDAFDSLLAQTFTDWEWIVLLNGKATNWRPPSTDPRVRTHRASSRIRGVGSAKRAACELATGAILVELDHDDRLHNTALDEIARAFASNPTASLAYSDFTQINDDGSPNLERWDATNGWVYNDEVIDGTTYLRCTSLAATPHNVGYIWYAPNHVRAFRRTAYDDAGGYDASLVVLDDQDLMIRLFQLGEFVHIPRCLYFQRVHRRNTQADPALNAAIQDGTIALYREHIESMTLAWASRNGLGCVALDAPANVNDADIDERFTRLMIDPDQVRLGVPDGALGVVNAVDILSRVRDRASFLNEAHRALDPAGLLLTDTPSTDGRGAFQDPSLVAFYNENSFMYLTQERLRRTIPALTSRWQISHLMTYYPSPIHEAADIAYVKANLLPVNDEVRQGGPLTC
ncbi:MAG TPA: glycosyltransferase [Mycobacteriales bacterium]|nr:glycosyltransferase [Mycobacteriales bacterium]